MIGKSDDGNYYYCLGGNQGGAKGARNVQVSRYAKSVIDWFVIPPNYNPTEDEYNLEIMTDASDIDDINTTRN